MPDIEDATTIDWVQTREQASTPATPASGQSRWYTKTDGKPYHKNDAGTETDLSAGGGSSLPVDDTTAIVRDPVDNTKLVRIDAGTVATATTRVITMPDADVDLADVNDLPVANLANGTDGELITWDATGAPATVSVGTSGQVLTSNGAGAAPTFQDASGGSGAWTEIVSPTALGSSQTTITLSTIPATYQDLVLVLNARGTSTGFLVITVNADTGTNYARNLATVGSTGTITGTAVYNATSWGLLNVVNQSGDTASYFGALNFKILAYADSAITRGGEFTGYRFQNAGAMVRSYGHLTWENVANAITSIELNLSAGDFDTGTTYALYGVGTAS